MELPQTLLAKNSTKSKSNTFRRFKKVMISDLIKRRKKINPKTKSLLKSKSPLLSKRKNKSSSEKVIQKSTSKL